MIGAPKPGSDAWRILELLVREPGRLDAEAIGQRLWRPRLTSTADYLRVRAAIAGSGQEWSKRAGVILGRLTAAGYVRPVGPPELADDLPTAGAGTRSWAVGILIETRDETPAYEAMALVTLLIALVKQRPASVAAWVGASPSGATRRAVAHLYEAGLVVPGCFRWPTAKAEALVEHREVASG